MSSMKDITRSVDVSSVENLLTALSKAIGINFRNEKELEAWAIDKTREVSQLKLAVAKQQRVIKSYAIIAAETHLG